MLCAREELSDLVVVAGQDRDTLVTFASDDDTQAPINPGLVVRLPELLVEKARGALLRRDEVATTGVVRLDRLKDQPDGTLLL